jgi:hypothetical protein
MYRIDAVFDRIQFDSIEAENSANNFRVTAEKFREKFFLNLVKDLVKSRETQIKINRIVNKPGRFEELSIIFDIIDKHLDDERQKNEKGIAAHLLAILLNSLEESEQLWMKITAMIEMKDTQTLDKFLKRQTVMTRMSSVIQNYLNSLCQVGDEFFVDSSQGSSPKFFESFEVFHMIIIIHHLLNNPKTSAFFYHNIFTSFDLSSTFITFLRHSLRNLSL